MPGGYGQISSPETLPMLSFIVTFLLLAKNASLGVKLVIISSKGVCSVSTSSLGC
ncbi:hypothetical protein MtrunA17_Chr4g0033881 [Medicago truncatula]|uniref:Transmembrane protein n=1 Tax=Medicago truncatula TaxID=3880 RepID=A0A396IBV4_MEDTR|nr:hypothetical protein MtrunA17_Chr4g0033881 [Medicago truncatula]